MTPSLENVAFEAISKQMQELGNQTEPTWWSRKEMMRTDGACEWEIEEESAEGWRGEGEPKNPSGEKPCLPWPAENGGMKTTGSSPATG